MADKARRDTEAKAAADKARRDAEAKAAADKARRDAEARATEQRAVAAKKKVTEDNDSADLARAIALRRTEAQSTSSRVTTAAGVTAPRPADPRSALLAGLDPTTAARIAAAQGQRAGVSPGSGSGATPAVAPSPAGIAKFGAASGKVDPAVAARLAQAAAGSSGGASRFRSVGRNAV